MTTDTEPTTEPDLSKLEKIRALLDKAESTASTFPEEAEALTAKAIELMERYRIDEMMLADSAPLQSRGEIIETRVVMGSGPYSNARVILADQIARAHSSKLVVYTNYKGKSVGICGYETDVALTEMLYTSLLVQATRAAGSPEVKATKPGHQHGTAFTRAFLLAFAFRIGERLQESNKVVAQDHDGAGSGSRSVAVVLADRVADVNSDFLRRHGKLRKARPTSAISSSEGFRAGQSAADKADLSTNRRVSGQSRKALSA